MNKKLKEKLESLDLKSALLTVIFFVISIILFYFFKDIRERFRQEEKEEFTGQTTGKIISIEPIERMKQTKWKGTELFIDSYKVMYRYDANGQLFQKTDFLPLTTKNEKFIKQILERERQLMYSLCVLTRTTLQKVFWLRITDSVWTKPLTLGVI